MQTQEVAVAPSLRVILKSDSEILDEVTVIAYGTAKKNSLTGSVATIKSSDMEKLPVTSFEKALQGLSPGLQIASVSGQPGSSTQVRIRGIGSMSASSTPLYVIDGVAIEAANLSEVANTSKYGTSANPLSNLNPNDIESITILKDASAASLYGSRAANGVILITTKQGKKGQAKVSFKAQMSSSKLPSGGYDLMNASEHYALYYGGFYNNNIAKGMSSEEASAAANKSTQSMYGRNPYNVANPLDASGDLTSGAQLMIDTDWLDEVFRTGMSQEYDISVNGGNEKKFGKCVIQPKRFVTVGKEVALFTNTLHPSEGTVPVIIKFFVERCPLADFHQSDVCNQQLKLIFSQLVYLFMIRLGTVEIHIHESTEPQIIGSFRFSRLI